LAVTTRRWLSLGFWHEFCFSDSQIQSKYFRKGIEVRLDKKRIRFLVAVVTLSSAMMTGCGESKNNAENQEGNSGVCSSKINSDFKSALNCMVDSSGTSQCIKDLQSFLSKYPNVNCIGIVKGETEVINHEQIQEFINQLIEIEKQTGSQQDQTQDGSGACSTDEISDLKSAFSKCNVSSSDVTLCKNAMQSFLNKHPTIDCSISDNGQTFQLNRSIIQKMIDELEKVDQ